MVEVQDMNRYQKDMEDNVHSQADMRRMSANTGERITIHDSWEITISYIMICHSNPSERSNIATCSQSLINDQDLES